MLIIFICLGIGLFQSQLCALWLVDEDEGKLKCYWLNVNETREGKIPMIGDNLMKYTNVLSYACFDVVL